MDPLGDFPPISMLQMITAGWVSQCIYAVAKLEVAELLSEEPRSIKEIAQKVNADEGALYRVMRLLASKKIFEEKEAGFFVHTPLSECLQKSAFGSVRAMALLCGEEHYKAWGDITQSV